MVVQMAGRGRPEGHRQVAPKKLELCIGHADLALNYKTDDIPARLREFASTGSTLVRNLLRAELEVSIPLLRKRGRMILMAGRAATASSLARSIPATARLIGFAMFNATAEEQQRAPPRISTAEPPGLLKLGLSGGSSLPKPRRPSSFLKRTPWESRHPQRKSGDCDLLMRDAFRMKSSTTE